MSLDIIIARQQFQRRVLLVAVLIGLWPLIAKGGFILKDKLWKPPAAEVEASVRRMTFLVNVNHPGADLKCTEGEGRWDFVCTYLPHPDTSPARLTYGMDWRRGQPLNITRIDPTERRNRRTSPVGRGAGASSQQRDAGPRSR